MNVVILAGTVKEIKTITRGTYESRHLFLVVENGNKNIVVDIEFPQKFERQLDSIRDGSIVCVKGAIDSREWEKNGKKSIFTSVKGFSAEAIYQDFQQDNGPGLNEQMNKDYKVSNSQTNFGDDEIPF
jgi:hypothetical protein